MDDMHDTQVEETLSETETVNMQEIKANTRPQKKDNGESLRDRLDIPPGYFILWLIALASVLINVIVIRQLVLARTIVDNAIGETIEVLGNFKQQSFSYTVVVDDSIIVDTDIPIQMVVPVEIDEVIPVGGTVSVPIDLGPLGSFPVDVPFSSAAPVQITVDVEIDESLAVFTEVPVNMDIPIELALEETPLNESIDDVIMRLEALREQIAEPLVPGLPGNANE